MNRLFGRHTGMIKRKKAVGIDFHKQESEATNILNMTLACEG